MANIGFLFAAGTLLCWTIGTYSFTSAARILSPSVLNKGRLLISIFILSGLTCLLNWISPFQLFYLPSREDWFWFGLSGIAGLVFGDYCGFTAMKILGPRRSSMLSIVAPGFTLVFGLLIIDEKINWVGILGIFITIASIFFILNDDQEKLEAKREDHGKYWLGILMGIGSAFGQGLGLVLAKKGLDGNHFGGISPIHIVWIRVFVAFWVVFLMGVFRKDPFSNISLIFKNKAGLKYALQGIIISSVLGLSFSIEALKYLDVSVAQTIFSLLPVTVVIFGQIIFKHKITRRVLLFSILAISGVLVLIWRNWMMKHFGF